MTLFAESFAHRAKRSRALPEFWLKAFCVYYVHSLWLAQVYAKSSEKICFLSARSVLLYWVGRQRPLSLGGVSAEFASRGDSSGCCCAADSHIKAPPALIETQMPIKRRITAAQCQKGAFNCTLFCFATSLRESVSSLHCEQERGTVADEIIWCRQEALWKQQSRPNFSTCPDLVISACVGSNFCISCKSCVFEYIYIGVEKNTGTPLECLRWPLFFAFYGILCHKKRPWDVTCSTCKKIEVDYESWAKPYFIVIDLF